MPMGERPSANDRVQLADQVSCRGLLVFLDHRADFLQERFDILLRWFDEHLAVVRSSGSDPRSQSLR